MRICAVVLPAFATALFASAAAGDRAGVAAEPVAEGIYMLHAQGGNIGAVIGAVIGEDGIFLIDDQFAPLTAKIRAALDALPGGKGVPVRFVLNTHFHADHTGGNENLGEAGAVIVAHDNVRARMTTDEFRKAFLESGGGSLDAALPVVTFNDRVTFHLDGRTLASRHFAHGHTDGDSIVWFREADAVHMGDLYFQVGYPFIDVDHGGSVDGLIAAVEAVLEDANDDTVVIPGHGALSNGAELREYLDMLTGLRAAVAEQARAGKSLAEVKAMSLSKPYDARWSWEFISGERFVETLYRSLGGAGVPHDHEER